ncbi:hypothetical protein [Kaistia adipata]|uniref:hypothetical protein n=1 Tax=Kaistia adipata TaxID=166954 RepID=UPI00041BE493|nr:hypothetical protein [Kaistia adipata]
MIPASYLFKSLYQSRFEQDGTQAHEAEPTRLTPRDGQRAARGAHHRAVPYLAILGLFGLAR